MIILERRKKYENKTSAAFCQSSPLWCLWSAVPFLRSLFSNSDLPVGNYNSNDDFSYKEIISQLITKYPDYFKNYVFMIPQSDSSFSQYGFYWFNCDESKNFEIVKNGSQYSLKNTDNKPFKSYRCFWNYRNNEFSNVYLNGESSSDCDYPLSWQIYTFGSNCNVKIGDDDVIKTLTLHQFPLLSIIPLLSLRA